MRYWLILPALVFAVGLYLIGHGAMTGFVISQSCCFPPQCAAENVCDAVKPMTAHETPIGFVLIVVSFGLYRAGVEIFK
ncbi:MAG: hypothetical protein V1725_02495 [archaeon]